MKNLIDSKNYILDIIKSEADYAIVLGSGLSNIIDKFEIISKIPYESIPSFPKSTVEGHNNCLYFASVNNKKVFIFSGRFHYYEGQSSYNVAYITRVAYMLGVKNIIYTNAAGGINPAFKPGDIMAITDHIGLFCKNPLVGEHIKEFGPRFPDMSKVYNSDLIDEASKIAVTVGLDLKRGVYAYASGPSYETPAEIKMLGLMGASAVGMSTVPEVVVAASCGLKVVAFSCITNMAAGVIDAPLKHSDVLKIASEANEKFSNFIFKFVETLK